MQRRDFIKLTGANIAASFCGSCDIFSRISGQKKTAKPNIVIILADDQGYGGSGAYGGDPKYVRTPNLDEFASEGMRFTNGYVMNPVCGPSRASLMTGRYGQRFGYYTNEARWVAGGLPVTEKTIPQYLKPAGYSTALVGKWHLGEKGGRHPLDKGFDEFYGFDSSGTSYFESNIMYRGREKVSEHEYLTTAFTKEAVSFIERKHQEPFFLYLAYSAVHDPVEATEEYKNRFDTGSEDHDKRSGMLNALDDGVGKIMDALKRTGVDDNTLIFYLSDNGGLANWPEGNNGKLRGFKRSLWEGGIRVHYMVRWPGKVPKGKVCDEVVSAMDILPTSLNAAGLTMPEGIKIDGKDITGLMTATSPKPVHQDLIWANRHYDELKVRTAYIEKHGKWPPHGMWKTIAAGWVVRSGKWKLIDTGDGPLQLFDLEADISEENDLSSQYPEIVSEMKQKFIAWIRQMKSPLGWDQKYYQDLMAVQ
ncbi:MAG: sulfatase-like hydrolase/transferase [Planctomycetes bacterium]|nr:sulfatase-like hydrolase/transferase [Planctomycetota bacterium]